MSENHRARRGFLGGVAGASPVSHAIEYSGGTRS
jgi:hypothetical protein